MLTVATVRSAMPRPCAYKLHDAGGLMLHISPAGTRSWRWKFRMGGREQLLTLGHYPAMSLAEARTARDDAREQLHRGIDPRRKANSAHGSSPFEAVARAWHSHNAPRWSAQHGRDVIEALERHVFPAIGGRAIGSLRAAELLDLLTAIEDAGAHETARRTCQRIAAVFGFALTRQIVPANPALGLARELGRHAGARHNHPALTTINEARSAYQLLRQDRSPAGMAGALIALTGVRLHSARGALFSEFTLDGDEPCWRIPPARLKMARRRKADQRNILIIPLSPAARALIAEARSLTTGDIVFPGRGTVDGMPGFIGEGAIGALHRAVGLAGRHCPHGWRATFSTIMNELRPDDRSIIDQALGHVPKDRVEAAYNRAAHMARRRALFDAWAAALTGPISGT